jgi:hypothetical protein
MQSKDQVSITIITIGIILLFLGVLFIFMIIYYRVKKRQAIREKEKYEDSILPNPPPISTRDQGTNPPPHQLMNCMITSGRWQALLK